MSPNNSSKKSENSPAPKNNIAARSTNKKNLIPYIIIAMLLVIIVVGVIFMIAKSGRESVQIASFSPLDEVQQTTNFTITFSREVVNDSLVNIWLDQVPISFKPEIRGKFQWIARDKIRFYPDELLRPATEYDVNISPRLVATYGLSLKGDNRFQIHTPRFKVNSASLNFEFTPEREKEAKLISYIEFNYDVDPAEAVKYISIRYKDGGIIPYKIITQKPGRIIQLEAEKVARGEEEQQIQLKVAKGLLPIGGNLGLFADFIKPIVMPKQQDLNVERMAPRRDSPTTGHIQIQFNLPVGPKNVAQFIRVKPAVKYKAESSHL